MVGGWLEVFWLPAVLCLAFFSVISLVVEGAGCVAWLFCWGWVFFAWPVFSSMFVVGEEGGWVFPAWPSFCGGLGVGWGLFSICLAAAFWLWFCLESLILAQDERWRRA